jgi:hypothetical protein
MDSLKNVNSKKINVEIKKYALSFDLIKSEWIMEERGVRND